MNLLDRIENDEAWRLDEFPVARNKIFLSHAAVTVLPRRVADAIQAFTEASVTGELEIGRVLTRDMDRVRVAAAELIGAKPNEIALLGPTSLGLGMIATGFPWREGDEVICYADDYPANVYPWLELERRGVRCVKLMPDETGEITRELVESALTERTRMVALASCHFLSGYRIDHDAIGGMLRELGIFFCLDGIQTVGAFPTRVENVDFLSADSHKWLLGPMTAGIVYVREELQEMLRPPLLGAWNVQSPNFIPQEEIVFESGARRYEPGVINVPGLLGMMAAIGLITEVGTEAVGDRILQLKRRLVDGLTAQGWEMLGPQSGPRASGITTFSHPTRDLEVLNARLLEENIVPSLRHDRAGTAFIRFSPHFYNTFDELDRVLAVTASATRE